MLAGPNLPRLIITHDPEDADAFAGRLVTCRDGRAREVPDFVERRAAFPDAESLLRRLLDDAEAPIQGR